MRRPPPRSCSASGSTTAWPWSCCSTGPTARPSAGYPAAFVQRLVSHAGQALNGRASPAHEEILKLVFDNTRRAIAHILATETDRAETAAMITAFWSYQIPGLNGLTSFINADLGSALMNADRQVRILTAGQDPDRAVRRAGYGTSVIVAGPRCRLA